MKRRNRSKKVFAWVCLLAFLLGFVTLPALSQGSYRIRINVPSRQLHLLLGEQVLVTYPVGVGSSAHLMTPPGNYEVNQKVVHPIWEHPYKKAGSSRIGSGSANPLGNHWIGFHAKDGGFYGIHGTNRPASVGKFVSHGCVRMHNEDVETLFELVRVGTPVKVTYDRYRLEQRGRSLLLEIFPDPYQIKPLNEQDIISRIRSKAPYAHIKHSVLEKALRDQARDTLYEVALLYHLSYPADGRTQNFPSPSVSPFTSRYAGVYGTFGRQSYLFY